MREEFEKLPEIEEGLRHCHYDESTGIYHADAAHVEEFEWHTQFVNGAWYAYQEQQKNIDTLNKRIEDALNMLETETENSWKLWKEKADMYEQGAANAYERAYWILKGNK